MAIPILPPSRNSGHGLRDRFQHALALASWTMKDILRHPKDSEDVAFDINVVGQKCLAERGVARPDHHAFPRFRRPKHKRATWIFVFGRSPTPTIPETDAEWRTVIAFENRIEQTGSFTVDGCKHLVHLALRQSGPGPETCIRMPDIVNPRRQIVL